MVGCRDLGVWNSECWSDESRGFMGRKIRTCVKTMTLCPIKDTYRGEMGSDRGWGVVRYPRCILRWF